MKKLVVLGSSLTALSLIRVAKRIGIKTLVADDIEGPACLSRKSKFTRLGFGTELNLLHQIGALAGGSFLIADSDRWLRFVARWYCELEQQGAKVLHPKEATIQMCLDKSEFLFWCANNQVPAPKLYEKSGNGGCENLPYPVLIRPRQTLHSSPVSLPKALEIQSPEEMKKVLEAYKVVDIEPVLCESVLRPNLKQYSVGFSLDEGGEVVTCVAEKVRPSADRCDGGTFVTTTTMPMIDQLAQEILSKLDYFGIGEIEILYDADLKRAYTIEINARPWLQFALTYCAGRDLLSHALGLRSTITHHHKPRTWLNFTADFYHCFSRSQGSFWEGDVNFANYVQSVCSADTHALWDWNDPNPALMSALMFFRRKLKSLIDRLKSWRQYGVTRT